jgi:hypothetical protein
MIDSAGKCSWLMQFNAGYQITKRVSASPLEALSFFLLLRTSQHLLGIAGYKEIVFSCLVTKMTQASRYNVLPPKKTPSDPIPNALVGKKRGSNKKKSKKQNTRKANRTACIDGFNSKSGVDQRCSV